MSKKKIIAGIMGSATLISGDGTIATVVTNISKTEEKLEEENKNEKETQYKSKIRNKRNSLDLEYDNNLFENCFVEKIYDYENSIWKLSIVLNKKISLKIMNLIIESHKLDISAKWSRELNSQWKINWIKETKKIIKGIKNNSINLSAKDFDDNAIDAFVHQIWKNFPQFCDLIANLGINQQIQIKSTITGGYWGEFKFQVIGEKNEWEKNDNEIKQYFEENYSEKLINYVEKIIKNENKKITIKYQKNDIIIILDNEFAKTLLKNILYTKYEDFEELFTNQIRIYIIKNNYFLNSNIPTISELKKIAQILFLEKEKYNTFWLKSNLEKIIIKLNLNNKILEFNNNNIFDNENQNNIIEKIYNYNESTWNSSIILSKNNCEKIIKKFINNNKNEFILETKKIITDIKNNSINLSAENFDDNAIDAFAHQIWKNFPQFCDLIANLGINQQIQIKSTITGGYWGEFKFQVIGEKNDLEKINEKEKRKKIKSNNFFTKCKNDNSIVNKNNVFEKWYRDKHNAYMKIKINKITWIKIFILFFLIKEKSIFIEKITELFKNFWNQTSTKLEEEDLTSFSHLIWANANIYYDIFQKLEKNECIRINSYMGYPEGYWTTEKFNDYNEIVDKNNDVIDWTTFNDRNQNKKVTDENKWGLKSAVDIRKKRSDNWKNMWWPFNESNFIFDNLRNVLTNTDGLYLENLSNLTPEIIIQTLSYNNPLLDVSQISVNINEKKGIINIKPSFLSKYIGTVEIHLSNKSKKNESKKMNFNFKQLRLINNQYDVLGDGNCLFWSVATAYLLQVRTDDVNFENRFIQLFGLKNKKYLRKTQNLLKIFDLRNYDANQDWYRNPISERLISDFRIRVIRYIHIHLDDNHIQNSRAIFRNAIIQEEEAFRREEAERNKIQFSVSEEERRNFAISYLERMMKPQQWGGSIEIEAMTDLLNTNIMVNDIRFEPDIETENSIQLFHINENHYNFGLSNIIENLEESIVNDNLGFISDNNEDTILQRLQELNPGLDINQIYMGKIDNNDSTVEIYSKSHSNYIGQKLIAFNLKSSNRNKKMKCNRYISSIIVNNDLGFISDNNEDTILQRLQELNPELDINQIYMGKIDNNDSTVEIYSKSHSNYIGRKLINFKIKISKPQKDKKTEKLIDIIKNTDLGFISNSLPQVIKNRLQELNPGLDINQIYISKISKNIAEVKSNFYLDKILVKFISNIKPPEGQWESQNVDLNQLMPIPMKYQKKDFWCSLAVLENLLVNLSNKSNTKLSQDYLYNYFDKLNLNPDHDTGILLYNIYKFLSKHKNLNFSYSHINFENKFWKTLSENETKILWVQYLIWNSLKMNIPVIANTILNKNEGHSILIIGIEPNIDDPFKTQYVIRDSGVNENEPTERKMIAIDLFSMFFNPYLCFGEMLIGSSVATKFFISHLIVEHLKVDSINFQNLIENLNEFSSDELETLLSTDDTICTSEAEQKLLNLFNEDKNE